MPGLAALLDACVLIPTPLRDTLLLLAEAGFYRPHWSEEILEEVRRNLVKRGMATEAEAQSVINALRAGFPEACARDYAQISLAMTNDPKDRHVLAAAVVSGAPVIVTANLRDFPPSSVAPHGIEVRTPDAFLTELFERDPAGLAALLERQAATLDAESVDVHVLLEKLAVQAPEFARRLGACLSTGGK